AWSGGPEDPQAAPGSAVEDDAGPELGLEAVVPEVAADGDGDAQRDEEHGLGRGEEAGREFPHRQTDGGVGLGGRRDGRPCVSGGRIGGRGDPVASRSDRRAWFTALDEFGFFSAAYQRSFLLAARRAAAMASLTLVRSGPAPWAASGRPPPLPPRTV